MTPNNKIAIRAGHHGRCIAVSSGSIVARTACAAGNADPMSPGNASANHSGPLRRNVGIVTIFGIWSGIALAQPQIFNFRTTPFGRRGADDRFSVQASLRLPWWTFGL
jgi:hypothetical protein